jgi:dienelactone hydrolase
LDGQFDEFARFGFTQGDMTRSVYRAGAGPAVIVIHGLPGLHATTIAFARRLVDDGYTVYLPSMFGRPGQPFSLGYLVSSLPRASTVTGIVGFAPDRASPALAWLRALAYKAHRDSGHRGVAAVGMSVTAGLALRMLVDDHVSAAVLSQPVLPIRTRPGRRRHAPLTAAGLERIVDRAGASPSVLALRFSHDLLVPSYRFRGLCRELGPAVRAIELDSSPGNPHGVPRRAHAVITGYLGTVPDYPTRLALDRTLAFLRERLA